MRLVLLGAPGAGKGTQGQRLAEHFGIPRVATGDMFRAALASDGPLGRQVRQYVEQGALVPDELTIALVEERLKQDDCRDGFILDGFPRTVAQAEALDGMLEKMGRPLHAAAYLELPVEEAVRRITMRRVCGSCGAPFTADDPRVAGGRCPDCGGDLVVRPDDQEETVRHRFAVYEEATAPVIGYYREKSLLVTVDGQGTVDDVFAALLEGLQRMAGSAGKVDDEGL